MLGEVFDSFDRLEAKATKERQLYVAQGGEHLRRMAGVGTHLILAAGDIADVMQLVFDAPVLARQFEQTCGARFVRSQAVIA